MDRLLDGDVGIERALDGLAGEGIGSAVLLQVLFQGLSLVGLSAVGHYWVLHEVKSDSALEIVGDAEDDLLVGGLKEGLHLLLLYSQLQRGIAVEVLLSKEGFTLYSEAAAILELRI